MKVFYLIVFALAATVPTAAIALPLSEYQLQPGDTIELFVAGSSAQDKTLQRLFRLVCAPGSLDIYRANGGNARLMFCRARPGNNAIAALPENQKIALQKTSLNGSGSGVGPLIQMTIVPFVNVADLKEHYSDRCPAAKTVNVPADGQLAGYAEHDCQNPTPTMQIPDGGITDVEPRFFLDAYHLSPGALKSLSIHSANAFIFGIPVTLALRNALQAARFPRGNPCNPNNPHYRDAISVGGTHIPHGESEACMPSLSRAQLAGIFAGSLTRWGQIVDVRGYPLAAAKERSQVIASPPGVKPPSDDAVNICRRVDTSGTQAAYEMFFLNQRCAADVRPFVENGENVFVGSVTGDVEYCLAELDRRNVWAVGILSTENVESLKDGHWRFIKMDGVLPDLLNTFNGRWPFFVEQSYQWRNERSERPLQGMKLWLMSQIGVQLGNPAIIRDLNRGFNHPWGTAGVMALPSNLAKAPMPVPGKPVGNRQIEENPVLAVAHGSSNCSGVIAQETTALQ